MESLDAATRDALDSDCRAVQQAFTTGLSARRIAAQDARFQRWSDFRQQFNRKPFLGQASPPFHETDEDPIPWLLLWASRLRSGEAAARGRPLRSRAVEDSLRAVATAHTLVGRRDPRHTATGLVDPRLARLLKSYAKTDPQPTRVKPLPVPLLHRASAVARNGATPFSEAVADCMWIAFFFLNRPGEYTAPTPDSAPFRLCDVSLWLHAAPLDIATASVAQLQAATFVALTFTTQKNSVRGEKVGHGRSGDPIACPVLTIVRRILHLRLYHAPPDTPLCHVYSPMGRTMVRAKDITAILRQACHNSPEFNVPANSVTARSLRASGAMALLCQSVDPNIIRLLGRWRSDEMFRYLHLQAEPLMHGFAKRMLLGGNYRLLPPDDPPGVPLL